MILAATKETREIAPQTVDIMPGLEDFPELTKTVTPALSDFCYRYMLRCGIEDGYYQDLAAATDEMIPEFDLTGVDSNTIKN